MGMGRGGGGAMPAVVSRKRYLGAINSPPSALKLVFLCFVEVFARICSVLKLWMITSFNDHSNLFSRSLILLFLICCGLGLYSKASLNSPLNKVPLGRRHLTLDSYSVSYWFD